MVFLQKEQIYDLIDEKIKLLPYYVDMYVDYKRSDDRAKPNTILSYLYDYERFFNWLVVEGYAEAPVRDIPLSVLEKLKREDITSFQNYLKRYTNITKRSSRNRMISSLKSLFHHLSQIEEDADGDPLLTRNIMAKIEIKNVKPSPKDQADSLKGRVFKSHNEVLAFLEFVEHGYEQAVQDSYEKEPVKKRLIHYYYLNKERDLALLSLILGSGLRVNETVTLDITDVDWIERGVRVERKGKEGLTLVHISNRAKEHLSKYIAIREERYKCSGKEKALFLSLPTGPNVANKRLTKRAAQELVMKYTRWHGRQISVHNLRHSFATIHWAENHDVFGLQSQLGHNDPQTTQRYSLIFDDTLRKQIDKMDKEVELKNYDEKKT